MVIKILVLEDNDSLLFNYKIMFEYNNYTNYTVKLVKNCLQALSLLKDNFIPDVIISETRVNGTDGFKFYELMANNYIWQGIPFIFVTSYINESIMGKLKESNVPYLLKPFSDKNLLTLIDETVLLAKNNIKNNCNREKKSFLYL